MKNLQITALLLILVTSKIYSQTLPLYDNNTRFASINNAYYKDIDNVHDQFVGSWVYINGNQV